MPPSRPVKYTPILKNTKTLLKMQSLYYKIVQNSKQNYKKHIKSFDFNISNATYSLLVLAMWSRIFSRFSYLSLSEQQLMQRKTKLKSFYRKLPSVDCTVE